MKILDFKCYQNRAAKYVFEFFITGEREGGRRDTNFQISISLIIGKEIKLLGFKCNQNRPVNEYLYSF